MASGPQWGKDPHEKNPLGAAFQPEYVCIIYFRFDDPKKTMVRQGYFATAMGGGKGGSEDVVIWSSSNTREFGESLMTWLPPHDSPDKTETMETTETTR